MQFFRRNSRFASLFIMASCRSLAATLALFLQLAPVRAIYFIVTQAAPRCFIEEMPGQTLFLATYKNPDFKPFGTPGFSDTAVIVRVVDPSGATVLSRVADTAGKVAFHSTAGGEYQLCFSTNSSRWVDNAAQQFVRGRGARRALAAPCSRAPLSFPPFLPCPLPLALLSAWT